MFDTDEEEDNDSRTITIYAATVMGDMVDFLKANPYITREEYLYQLPISQIELMSRDFTHIKYLSEKQINKLKKIKQRNGKSKDAIRITSVREYNQYKNTGKVSKSDSSINKIVVPHKSKETNG